MNIQEIQTSMQHDIELIRSDIKKLEIHYETQMEQLRQDHKTQIEQLQRDGKTQTKLIRRDFKCWFGTVLIVIVLAASIIAILMPHQIWLD